ncbi:MAG: class I SAM-dependent methyltransferase [Jatrophihabitans sp.]
MHNDASWVETMPATYDRCLGPALFAPWATHLAAAAAQLSPERVLEIAAGTGILTSALVDALPMANIVATDLNPAMVAYATARLPTVACSVADAQALDLPDRSFDVIVCQFGVMFFPRRRAAYAQVARVLATHGTFLFSVWDEVQTSTLAHALVQSLDVVLPGGTPDFVARIPHGYADVGQITTDLAEAGLTAHRVERHVPRGVAASVRDVAYGFCYGTPLRFELEKRGELDSLAAAVGEEMTTRLGEGPVDGELAGYLFSAGVT